MRKLLMLPTPEHAKIDDTNSINQIVLRLQKALPEFGYELTSDSAGAEFIAGHAGQTFSNVQIDIAHTHGLYPTAYPNLTSGWHLGANQSVVNNLMTARQVTVPSDWVAQILRRDLHMQPHVIPWAIEQSEWYPGDNQGYVLYNKTRDEGVCQSAPVVELAKRSPNIRFLSTFGLNPTPNLKVTGRVPFATMQGMIRNAGVYFAPTPETFGISALEAMASGVPVLAWNHGHIPNIVKHGITGYIVAPGDIDGSIEGLQYIFKHRATLGANARAAAALFTWDKVAAMIANVYDLLFVSELHPKAAIVIPHHNYGQWVGETIRSAATQETTFPYEIIVVDDGSDAANLAIVRQAVEDCKDVPIRLIEQANGGVAVARNTGINATKADYICCLDADDRLGSDNFLQTLVDALDKDRGLGIVFSGLQPMNDKGELGNVSAWPKGFSWERQIAGANQVPTCCVFRREAWRRAGGYKSQYQPSEDAELWTRIVALGFRAQQITEAPWFQYRFHDGSLSDPIRKNQRPEPDWRTDKPYVNDKQFPLAAAGIARPVRNYDRPKVTVIVPVASYHVPYLGQALDSIERQTERYWECVVVNDTCEPLPGLAPYPWAKVVETTGGTGAGAARNLGVKHASAPFVTFLDADDMLLPGFLEKTLHKYQQTGRYVYTDWLSLNKQGQLEEHHTPEFVAGDVFMKPTPHAVNVLVKKTWFDLTGGFDESMVSWEDVDFFMRLAKAGICGARVAEPLFIYRYLTGQRREKGETIKAKIINEFNQRYREYIGGEKVCGCVNSKPGVPAVLQNASGQAVGNDQLVRVVYNGAPGQHTVAIGKQHYGYRRGGDVFYVKAEHALSYPDLFTPIAEVIEEKQTTPVPPPPPVIQEAVLA